MFLNASSANGSLLTGGAVAESKDSFVSALTKNIVAMLVWLVLSIINSSMVYTFLQHRYTAHPHTSLYRHGDDSRRNRPSLLAACSTRTRATSCSSAW